VKRLGRIAFIVVVSFCLVQDSFSRPPTLLKSKTEMPKFHVEKRATGTGKNKNIDDLFMELLLSK
tara:strand:- start:165 stop:359 length:195 start_codon:yes stop_codon:yes gene_type:complete